MLFEAMAIRTRVVLSPGLWNEDGISGESEDDGNVVREWAGGARGDLRVESTCMSVREDYVWGTRTPFGGKRQEGGTNMIEVVGAHKAHQEASGIVGVVVEEVCVYDGRLE